jgi:hypothetical protein
MFSVSIVGSAEPYADLQRMAARYPELVLDKAQQLIPLANRLVQQRLATRTPGQVKYPIQWTSEKQRKAFFATDGFGHGIPYKRTGQLMRSWEVVTDVTRDGMWMSVRNRAPAAPFVVGGWQQGYHATTGWPLANPIIWGIGFELQVQIALIPEAIYDDMVHA